MGEVKLHGSIRSPFSARVVWALKHKGIEYDFIQEDLRNKSPELFQYNPIYKKIPVPVHSGKPVCESTIIVEYIDEIWPNKPLLPTDPYERALVHFWLNFVEDKGIAVWKLFGSFGEDQEKVVKECLEMLKIIEEQCIGKKKFFGGDNINILDIVLGATIHWLQVLEDVIEIKILEAEKFSHLY